MICIIQQEKMDDEMPGPYVVLAKGQRHTRPLVGPNILEVIYTTGDSMIDLASALILTLSPEKYGSICDPFMTLKFESFEHVENLESYIIYGVNCCY
jgi:hypothetical protein